MKIAQVNGMVPFWLIIIDLFKCFWWSLIKPLFLIFLRIAFVKAVETATS
jgi:hypothetical protein